MNTMKLTLPIFALCFGLGMSAHAEATLTLNGIHNCCKSCENGLIKAVSKVRDVTLVSTKTSVTITAKNKADAKKAAAAILDAGYFGTSEDDAKPSSTAPAKAPEPQVKTATVSGLHLCCGKCAKAANEAIKTVAGITKGEAMPKVTTVTVEGDFKASDLIAALNKAGFNGKIQ
jgi:copper chaperone CopZ